MPFGEVMLEHKDCGGWVHSVSFSPSGDQLAWVAHNSSISVVDAAQKKEWVAPYRFFLVFEYELGFVSSICWRRHIEVVCLFVCLFRVTQLTTEYLPLISVLYVSPTEIVAAVISSIYLSVCLLSPDFVCVMMCDKKNTVQRNSCY